MKIIKETIHIIDKYTLNIYFPWDKTLTFVELIFDVLCSQTWILQKFLELHPELDFDASLLGKYKLKLIFEKYDGFTIYTKVHYIDEDENNFFHCKYTVHKHQFENKATKKAALEKLMSEMGEFLWAGEHQELDNELIGVETTITFFEKKDKNIIDWYNDKLF